jgi:hypothetical protein
MATFDESYTSTIGTYPVYKPFFNDNPEVIDQTYDTITVNISLTHYGTIYAVAIPKYEGKPFFALKFFP